MAKVAAELDYGYYNKSCSFEDLQNAVNKLIHATEAQFQEIKQEKWYHRLFDMVTFSKKREKRMAGQIGSLAQAQELLVEILVHLSATDTEVADLARTCIDDIRLLQENDIYLLQKINTLEDICILGIKKNEDIKDLPLRARQILSACLRHASLQYSDSVPSENQKAYANAVLNYIDTEAEIENISVVLSQQSEDVRRKILICVMEYIYLHDLSLVLTEDQQDMIDDFNLGRKTTKEIERRIKDTYQLRGVNGFIDKYKTQQFDSVKDTFFVDVAEGTDTSTPETNRTRGMSEEIARKIFQFAEDDHWSKPVETTNDFLVRKILGNPVIVEGHEIWAIHKLEGTETMLSVLDNDLLNKSWVTGFSIEDTAFIQIGDHIDGQKLYKVDIPHGSSCMIYSGDKSFEIVAMSDEKLLLKLNSGKLMMIDLDGKQISLSGNFDCAMNHFFFYKDDLWVILGHSSGWELCRFSPTGDRLLSDLKADKGEYAEMCSVFNGMLYVLVRMDSLGDYSGIGKYNIYSVDLENTSAFRLVQENIIIHNYAYGIRYPIKNCPNGWIFVGEDDIYSFIHPTDYNLVYFSFETETAVTIANGCGYNSQYKEHFFSKEETLHHLNEFYVIGNYIFYEMGKQTGAEKKAVVSLHEPMSVKLV